MSQERAGFATSADSSGLLGTPEEWEGVWGFLRNDPRWRGFEMYPWRLPGMDAMWSWTDFLFKRAESLGCNVVGIHGRTGGIHESYTLGGRLEMGVINGLMLPTADLVRKYGAKVNYLLIHGPEVRLAENRVALKEKTDGINMLYVENHIRPGALGAAVEVARELRHDGVNAGVMFDLVHYLIAYDHRGGNFRDVWEQMLVTIAWAGNQTDKKGLLPFGIHLPVGTNREDSLMIDSIDETMWRDLGQVIDVRPDTLVVLENQQAGLMGKVHQGAGSRNKQERRNKILIDMLTDNGVI